MAEQTQSSIVIDASPAQIMAVIADLVAYPDWSDGITSVKILSIYEEDRRPADARFQLASGPIKVTWKLTKAEVLTAMDGAYILTDNGNGSTTVEYKLAVDVKIPMIGMIKRKAEKVIVETALKGLKKRVESSATSAS